MPVDSLFFFSGTNDIVVGFYELSKFVARNYARCGACVCDKWWQNKIETRLIQRTIRVEQQHIVYVCFVFVSIQYEYKRIKKLTRA